MLDEEGEIVEQHVTGAVAEDDPDRDPENEIVHLQERDRRRAAPELFILDQRAGIEPPQHDAADIGQRIPADRDRSDRNGDRIEDGKGDGEKGHQRDSRRGMWFCCLWASPYFISSIGTSEAFVHFASSGIHSIPLYLRSSSGIQLRYSLGRFTYFIFNA